MTSPHSSPRTRRIAALLAAGITFSLAPMPSLALTAQAETPASSVTGLSIGARGDAVKDVQTALVNQGIAVAGGVDGIFGSGTEAAVKRFQERHGLAQTGKVDLATAIALGLERSELLGLTQGIRSGAVQDLQQRLIVAGFTPLGGADGVFGPGTASALKDFQRARGFLPTGTVNAATAAALASIDGSSAPTAGSTGSGDDGATAEPAPEPAPAPAPAPEPAPDPAPASTSSLAGLKIGSRGDLVKRAQQAIMDAGFTVVGGADGIYGALTANAVKSFQNANGLPVTGAVDEATAALLEGLGGETGATDDGHDHGHDHDPTVTSPFVGLRYGSLGSDVKALQQALMDAGIVVRGGADGVFGFATQAAVKQFQGNHGLERSGTVDAATANALASRNPAGSASTIVGLKVGALGNTVKQLQQSLIDAGVTVRGGADGIFGPATAQALKSFQTSQGLEATGVVDEATVAALENPTQPAAQPDPDDGGDQPAGEVGYAEFGEKSARVRALQQALVNAGIALRGGVDGDFGGGTSAAVMDFQRQNGLNVTGKVDAATASALGLEATAAPTAPDTSTVQLQYFPVQGKCYYGDTWGYPRSGGRTHLGVDIMATEGKLLYAVTDGTIDKVYTDYPGSLAGNGVRLRMPDGTYFFYAHMAELAEGIELGVPVKAGQALGTLGNTGNSGTPHLHFEIHPQGGSAINPYPIVKAIDACNVTEPLGLG